MPHRRTNASSIFRRRRLPRNRSPINAQSQKVAARTCYRILFTIICGVPHASINYWTSGRRIGGIGRSFLANAGTDLAGSARSGLQAAKLGAEYQAVQMCNCPECRPEASQDTRNSQPLPEQNCFSANFLTMLPEYRWFKTLFRFALPECSLLVCCSTSLVRANSSWNVCS